MCFAPWGVCTRQGCLPPSREMVPPAPARCKARESRPAISNEEKCHWESGKKIVFGNASRCSFINLSRALLSWVKKKHTQMLHVTLAHLCMYHEPTLPSVGFDHINRNAPVLIRTPKLTRFEPAQYWGGGPPGNSVVLNPFLF